MLVLESLTVIGLAVEVAFEGIVVWFASFAFEVVAVRAPVASSVVPIEPGRRGKSFWRQIKKTKNANPLTTRPFFKNRLAQTLNLRS